MNPGKPFSENTNLDELLPYFDHSNGYGLTKWAAEKLIHEAAQKFKVQSMIVRLGNVGGHSSTKCVNPYDFQSLICLYTFFG